MDEPPLYLCAPMAAASPTKNCCRRESSILITTTSKLRQMLAIRELLQEVHIHALPHIALDNVSDGYTITRACAICCDLYLTPLQDFPYTAIVTERRLYVFQAHDLSASATPGDSCRAIHRDSRSATAGTGAAETR